MKEIIFFVVLAIIGTMGVIGLSWLIKIKLGKLIERLK